MRNVQVPAAAKHDQCHHQERPAEHPQRGCDGKPGNTRSHNDEHVHGWTMRLADDGRLHYDAELIADGKVTEAPTSVLTRQATTAGR